MENTITNEILQITNEFKSVIEKFKKRSGVLSGFDIAWKGGLDVAKLENTPYGIGDGLGTTGWCVSASETLLYDNIFQVMLRYRGAKAKLISIDIKEQYYGYCYNGSQNRWHTAILVEDSGFKFVIDITCRQFGNEFIGKDIWDFATWQGKLRSPMCTHKITDFEDNQINILPVTQDSVGLNKDLRRITNLYHLRDNTNLDDCDREFLNDFVVNKFDEMNAKLILGNVSKHDYNYLNELAKILQVMPFVSLEKGYAILPFASKTAAKNWIELLLKDDRALPVYMLVSKTLNQACKVANIEFEDLITEYMMGNENDTTYVVLEFTNNFGVESFVENTELILPKGVILEIYNNGIYNAGKTFTPEKNTNTIFIQVGNKPVESK